MTGRSEIVEKVARAHCWALSTESEGRCGYESCRRAGRCMDEFSTAEIAAARAAIAATLDALREPSVAMREVGMTHAAGDSAPEASENASDAWRVMLAVARKEMLG